jgi:hypothetical protein
LGAFLTKVLLFAAAQTKPIDDRKIIVETEINRHMIELFEAFKRFINLSQPLVQN